MGYFPVRYDSRVVIYDRRGFIRLATGRYLNVIVKQIFNLRFRQTPFSSPKPFLLLYPWVCLDWVNFIKKASSKENVNSECKRGEKRKEKSIVKCDSPFKSRDWKAESAWDLLEVKMFSFNVVWFFRFKFTNQLSSSQSRKGISE